MTINVREDPNVPKARTSTGAFVLNPRPKTQVRLRRYAERSRPVTMKTIAY